jgi:hypothetical protein
MWALYAALAPYYLYLSIKAKSFGFFNAVNPSIYCGGMGLEKKSDVNKITPSEVLAKSKLVQINSSIIQVENIFKNNGFAFPIIAKPDIGCRGNWVKKIDSIDELKIYHEQIKVDYLIEELIDFKKEIGMFYVRLPNEKFGKITGIVEKKGIQIVGDGQSTIGELILKSYRYHLHYNTLFQTNVALKNKVLKSGESIELSSIGNHARGATFYDASNKITDNLNVVFDKLSKSIPEFYYGRYDIKFNTWEELEQGKNFKIIEINGSGSEPTHIYDPNHSFVFAVYEYMRHWRMMYQVAKQNKARGNSYFSLNECLDFLKQNKAYYKKL